MNQAQRVYFKAVAKREKHDSPDQHRGVCSRAIKRRSPDSDDLSKCRNYISLESWVTYGA